MKPKKVKNNYSTREEKAKQLGMNFGTANNQLNKNIVFWLVQQTGKDTCYRCGEKITSAIELSKDHINDWLHSDNAKSLFFDLENITFSHVKCNRCRLQRLVTKNKTGYKGVTFDKRRNVWRAKFCINNGGVWFGPFSTAKEAAIAWDKKSVEVYGKDAVTNFPIENYLPESINV